MIKFVYPYAVLLIFLPFVIRYFSKNKMQISDFALKVPFVKDFSDIKKSILARPYDQNGHMFRYFWFLMLIWFFVVLALMRPIKEGLPMRLEHEGRDILLITDISTSMLEDDFVFNHRRVTRLEAVRAIVSDFVSKRLNDRLGLVLFGTKAYLQAPLTFDRQAVLDVLSSMQAGMAGQSTSIGDAIALGLKNLSTSKTKKDNQVIILLTDGENNDGAMSFAQAIALAKDEGIKVYTIGVGSPAFSVSAAFFGLQNQGLDEKNLKILAEETQGRYFRAESLSDLIEAYRKIDALETDTIKDNYVYPKQELYFEALFAALMIAFCGLLSVALKGAGR